MIMYRTQHDEYVAKYGRPPADANALPDEETES
jgi:hypothetical protein